MINDIELLIWFLVMKSQNDGHYAWILYVNEALQIQVARLFHKLKLYFSPLHFVRVPDHFSFKANCMLYDLLGRYTIWIFPRWYFKLNFLTWDMCSSLLTITVVLSKPIVPNNYSVSSQYLDQRLLHTINNQYPSEPPYPESYSSFITICTSTSTT